MDNTPFHLCKTCNAKYYKRPNCSKKDWPKSKYCSRQCLHRALVGTIPANKGKTMLEVNPNFRHGMLGRYHTDISRAKIKAKRAEQTITNAMLRGLIHGRNKVWTPEMRAGAAEHARRRKLGSGRGPESPNWRGGVTPLVRAYRVTPRYRKWRMSVLDRDAHQCLRCGATDSLEVNHIVTVKDIFKEYGFTTSGEIYECEILWDINNGETLCRSCHRLVSDKIDTKST